ncbi:hypothetical protein RJT34_15584 [Clitoria ternatea]|uniref:AAA+ ATPase domain-containing protein n=1 Tax=Clitoria ternatea TaxID=43366 RepID=A0AAN9J5Z9_CLITE
MDYASKIVERVIDVVLDLSVRHVAYIVCYRKNVDELNDNVNDLAHARERVKHQVDAAEKNVQRTEDDVIAWFEKVDEIVTEKVRFQNDEGHTKTRCSNGLFAYLRNRHRLGRKAKKMVEDVKLLIDKSNFGGVSYQQNITSNDATLFNAGYEEFGSRKSIMEDIMAQLEDSTVRMIGVHGPGGVGKSTLVKEIARRARENLFNLVVVVDITANPNILKIQEEIAYVLQLRLEGESETVRADRLRRRLKNEKENTLVVMDDLWDRLDLNKLGIPFDDDENDDGGLSKIASSGEQDLSHKRVKKEKSLGDYKGCKVLLTSRDKKVLSDKMDVKSLFCVKELEDGDAVLLFKKVAGIPEDDELSNSKQEMIKKYCAGIPMAIVTVGRALRDKSELVWKATLEKLKKQELVGVQESMEVSVKMSYDHLENEELKSIFLLCAHMGHQPLIMDLVKYCFGLGILEGVYTLREARCRIYTSIQKLKDSSLVLDGSSINHFNMHDMVRDAALSIAHKEQNVFALRNGKLDDWPDKDELERCTSISIRNSDIIDELPKVMNCPQLKFFQIDSDDPSLKIPESFFGGMEKLRVLILKGIHQPNLPSSIKLLLNLRMLCLERCILVDNLSIIGELKKLRILSFSGSQIENLPAELGNLDKLQVLDISNCSIIKMIAPNFISKLTCLEELYIRNSLIKLLVEEESNQSQVSFLSELKHLHQLKVVDICIPCVAVLPRDLFFDKLNDYKIVIGDFRMLSVGDFRMPYKYEAFRSLALQLKEGTDIHSQKGIKLLFKRVENLLLGELSGVQNVFYELNLDGFPDLKHLSITNNVSVEYIINSMDLSHPQDVFPSLESLCLYKLRNIKMICCSPLTYDSFTKLKSIKIKMCTRLKNLFSFYMVKLLDSLETIDVSECDSLKEIVETHVNSDKVEFPKLHSLTLESLPSFASFYTKVETQTTNRDHIEITVAEDEHNEMALLSLFDELVEIPNLESLKLSSINIQNIWSDRPPSMASNLKKLKGLFISECRMMESIFSTEGNNANGDKVCIFPKLEEIHLSKMSMLRDIWQAGGVSADSFSSLISVHIEGCEKLDKIFPSDMKGWFERLDSLKVVDCDSVEVIFEIKDPRQIDAAGRDTKLQIILVQRLPNLKQVWSTDPGGILNFKNLRSIEVIGCQKLSNVLPASVAKDLGKLEFMSVSLCMEMVEIVAWGDGSETNNEPLVFPELTYMELYGLSKLKHFYNGRHTIECPKLKQLAVDHCEKLKTFPTATIQATTSEEKPIFSAEKVIQNLEYMEIGFQVEDWLQNNTDKMPNLERLNLIFPQDLLEEFVPSPNIAPQERLGTVIQLKELFLLSSRIKDLGLEHDPVLQRLEFLGLDNCSELINLFPSSVSLTYLTCLEVKFCDRLKNLMASSTAKSLVQLKTMKVMQCAVKEIVTNEGREEDGMTEIVFSKLVTIELVALKCLTSFCSYKKCEFMFPSLEILIVRECPMMETFTWSHISAPKLQNIIAVEGEVEVKWLWEGDLNATIQKVFQEKVSFAYTKHLNLSDHPEFIEQLWHGNYLVQENNFCNLKSLEVAECNNLVHIIPSHLLHCFENLEELRVWNCSSAQVIFDINEIRMRKPLGMIRLKKLSLNDLPKLEHVWDKDPEGIIGLQVLQHMNVYSCDSLKSLFPASVTKELASLEVLEVSYCRELVELFSKDKKPAEGATKEIVFGCLTSLILQELPRLKYLYPGLHTLKWPVLQELDAFHCNLVILKCQADHPDEQVLIQIEEVIQIPCLKKLSFGIEDTRVTWHSESRKLRFDKLQYFQDSDSAPLCKFLGMISNIEKLELFGCLFEEMFLAERPNADYNKILLHLKELELFSLDNLSSIGLEHSWLQPFPKNLQTLQVKHCGNLINLAPSTVSFSNLTYLDVGACKILLYLFTFSTARSLSQLKRMKIDRCESMQEIVSIERDDESLEDEQIVFQQLQTLYLEKLHQLRCFYPGNFTLSFPSLQQVFVIDCDRMKTFSPINIISTATKWSSRKDATPREEVDLNSAVSRTFEEKLSKHACQVAAFSLRDNPLREIWHGSLPIPDMCFSNLDHLMVEGCDFLSDVLPFNLLPFFSKLKILEVRNCSSVKTIFDVKRITEETTRPTLFPLPFPLEKLILEELPNLENVWNDDPYEIMRMQFLQVVQVDKCQCLSSLFPASVARDLVKLEDLVVKHCVELVAIVAEDNADPKGKNIELTFPDVTSLTLLDLPNFKCFYCSLHRSMLNTFKPQEPHAKHQLGLEKVTPNLLSLTLGEKELKMFWHVEFQGNILHKIKVLTLLGFHIESNSNMFPYEFLLQVCNIEELVVSSSSFKEIFFFPGPNMEYCGLLSKLKVLRLVVLQKLVSIGLEHNWIEPFPRNLETLEVNRCSSLRNLAPHTVCFSNLMYLSVIECHGLVNLFTSSTAKSLAQLEMMEVKGCKSMLEIVSKEGEESHEDEEVIFGKLQTLYLEDLYELRCFYPGNFTLCFPSLEHVHIINTWMGIFCPFNKINSTKLSSGIGFSIYGQSQWEGDFNCTVRKIYEKKMFEVAPLVSTLNLRDDPLQELWYGSLPDPDMCFSNLETLIVEGCQFLSDVLPFNLLPLFTKLETLIVQNCSSVKTIFDVKCITEDRKWTTMGPRSTLFSFPLKKLILEHLPNLENVWNEDHGILKMQLLQVVYVDTCNGLTSLFPASVARDLVKLENLVVKHCENLMLIVAEDNADPNGTKLELTFPCVTSLTLWGLSKFKYFYGSLHYDMLPHTEGQVCFEKLTPNLQSLSLGENELKMIWHGEFCGNPLHKLKVLILLNFRIESDVFPYGYLQQVPNIEKLGIGYSSFKEIFCLQRPNVDYIGLLSQLKVLILDLLPELISIGLEHSWIEPFVRNLETLEVVKCFSLRNLAPSPICFSNLMRLFVFECHGLVNLFTSSTAKSLARLKVMEIKRCESIQEIVSKEGDESLEDEIKMWQLQHLNLEYLPNLISFYTGSSTLSFPSLEQLSVINCYKMETFCPGTINAEKLFGVKFQENSNAIPLEIDLNSTIQVALGKG